MAMILTPESAKGKIIPPIEIPANDSSGDGRGIKTLTVCAKINPNAATDAEPMIVKSVQPYKKEKKLP